MADLRCLCGFCRPRATHPATCKPSRQRLWVRADYQPDPTNHPELWRAQYQGGSLPVLIYGATPVEGEYYLVRHVCASSEYVGFIPETLGVGLFYVLYDDGKILRITQLADGGGAAEEKLAWKTNFDDGLGYSADYIAPASLGQDSEVPDVDRVNLMYWNSDTGLAHSNDSADSWASVITLAETEGANHFDEPEFDLTTQDLGWTPVTPYFDQTYVDAIKAQFTPPTGGSHDPAVVHANYNDWYASGGEIIVYRTTDGGASWSPISLGYLGDVLPARMYQDPTRTPLPRAGWFDTGQVTYCDSTSVGPLCSWEDCDPSTASSLLAPCDISGDFFECDVGSKSYLIKYRETSPFSGQYDITQYFVCNPADMSDPDNLVVDTPNVDGAKVAPFRDGSDAYVVINFSYPSATYDSPHINDQYVTPYFNWGPGDMVDGVAIYHLSGGASAGYMLTEVIEDRVLAVATDPTDTDKLFIVTNVGDVFRVSFGGETVTDVTPSGIVVGIGNIIVSADGTAFHPRIIYDIGADDYFLRIYRSTDQGASWSYEDVTPYSSGVFSEGRRIAESSQGIIAMMMSSGQMVFSEDDGATWAVTAAIGYDATGTGEIVQDIGAG